MLKLLILHRNTWIHSVELKLLVVDKNNWSHIAVLKLLVVDKNNWSHIAVLKLLVVNKNNWSHIAVLKLLVVDKKVLYASMLPQKSRTSPSVSGKNRNMPKRLTNQILDKIIQSVCLLRSVNMNLSQLSKKSTMCRNGDPVLPRKKPYWQN